MLDNGCIECLGLCLGLADSSGTLGVGHVWLEQSGMEVEGSRMDLGMCSNALLDRCNNK